MPIGCTFPGRPSADGRVERGVRICQEKDAFGASKKSIWLYRINWRDIPSNLCFSKNPAGDACTGVGDDLMRGSDGKRDDPLPDHYAAIKTVIIYLAVERDC